MTAARPEPENIAERAYSIWEQEGRPHGRDRAHWERAERELAGRAEPAGAPAADGPAPRKPRKPVAPNSAPAEPARGRKAPSAAAPATGIEVAPKRSRAKTAS